MWCNCLVLLLVVKATKLKELTVEVKVKVTGFDHTGEGRSVLNWAVELSGVNSSFEFRGRKTPSCYMYGSPLQSR